MLSRCLLRQQTAVAIVSLVCAAAPLAAQQIGYPQGSAPSGGRQNGQNAASSYDARPNDAAVVHELPRPFAISPREERYVDDILRYWQQRSAQVERFRCQFIRWEYVPGFGPRDPNIAKTISYGVIQYAKPDKGLFRVDRMTHYTPPPQNDANQEQAAGQNAAQGAQYVERPGEVGEHWVCDGRSVFVYDTPAKQLKEFQLPPEMQGQGIVDGPLPFLFGADAEKIKKRYWVRAILPPPAEGQYWLEAWPKRPSDAAEYKKLLVILDEDQYLPIAVQVFDRAFDRLRNPARISFQFREREENWDVTLQKLNLFHREFFEPKLPSGWQKVVERVPESPQRSADGAAPPTRR